MVGSPWGGPKLGLRPKGQEIMLEQSQASLQQSHLFLKHAQAFLEQRLGSLVQSPGNLMQSKGDLMLLLYLSVSVILHVFLARIYLDTSM